MRSFAVHPLPRLLWGESGRLGWEYTGPGIHERNRHYIYSYSPDEIVNQYFLRRMRKLVDAYSSMRTSNGVAPDPPSQAPCSHVNSMCMCTLYNYFELTLGWLHLQCDLPNRCMDGF